MILPVIFRLSRPILEKRESISSSMDALFSRISLLREVASSMKTMRSALSAFFNALKLQFY